MIVSKLILIVALAFTSHLTFSQKYQGDSWATVKSDGSGVLTVVYSEQFGLVFKDKDGKVKGVCVDILSDFARYIKEKYGKQLTIEYAGAIPVFSAFLSTTQNYPKHSGRDEHDDYRGAKKNSQVFASLYVEQASHANQ